MTTNIEYLFWHLMTTQTEKAKTQWQFTATHIRKERFIWRSFRPPWYTGREGGRRLAPSFRDLGKGCLRRGSSVRDLCSVAAGSWKVSSEAQSSILQGIVFQGGRFVEGLLSSTDVASNRVGFLWGREGEGKVHFVRLATSAHQCRLCSFPPPSRGPDKDHFFLCGRDLVHVARLARMIVFHPIAPVCALDCTPDRPR